MKHIELLSEKLKLARVEKGLSQQELADLCEVTRQTIGLVEKGKYNIFAGPNLSFSQLFDKLIAVYAVTGIIMIFFIVFSILGKRKIEKELE